MPGRPSPYDSQSGEKATWTARCWWRTGGIAANDDGVVDVRAACSSNETERLRGGSRRGSKRRQLQVSSAGRRTGGRQAGRAAHGGSEIWVSMAGGRFGGSWLRVEGRELGAARLFVQPTSVGPSRRRLGLPLDAHSLVPAVQSPRTARPSAFLPSRLAPVSAPRPQHRALPLQPVRARVLPSVVGRLRSPRRSCPSTPRRHLLRCQQLPIALLQRASRACASTRPSC